MNAEMQATFARIKPICDVVMMCPTAEAVAQFIVRLPDLKKEAVQELQQYLLFPFITHIKSTEMEKKYELQWKVIDAIRVVLERVTVVSFEMCIKIETGLLSLVFDNSKPGMIAVVPEELKLSVMKCLTALMVQMDNRIRTKMLRTQVPLIAQAVFVSVHLAKLERLRPLRLAAIDCVTAHTAVHRKLTTDAYHIKDKPVEAFVVDMLASILPGVLAALQDVATCTDNPGHAVVVAAIDATHRILCLTMDDKYLQKDTTLTAEDFAKMVIDKRKPDREVSNKEKNPKELSKRSVEWFTMAGEKLLLITKSLASLIAHEHPKVRLELAIYCARLLNECHKTMQPSVPIALDILISLSKDEMPEVSEYCSARVTTYFAGPDRHHAMDSLCENFFTTLTSLPRILNNIDSARKLSALNLLHGYITVMCDSARPQTLTAALSTEHSLQCLVTALQEACAVHTELVLLAPHTSTAVLTLPSSSPPWLRLRHVEGPAAVRVWECARLLGGAECAALILDRLPPDEPASVALANALASPPDAPPELAQRVIAAYTEESIWYLPLEMASEEPLTQEDTFDPTVYDPRSWTKDSVPGLYEGTTETRYTGISYAMPRAPRRRTGGCATLGEAQRNMALACLHAEGLGLMARRLMADFQPYLLKTLCLILERVGSSHEMLHVAGVMALTDIADACADGSVHALVRGNADYFTHQVTVRLKKAWNTESALQILSVVMEYSDASILDCLYGIVEDVLVQSLDKYHENNLQAYLQVFLTFITCIRKWFPTKPKPKPKRRESKTGTDNELNILKDLMEYVARTEEVDQLMNDEETEETKQSAEEMYREDQKKKDEGILDYDDKVTDEKPELPRHIKVTRTILKRCLNFLSSKRTEEAVSALQILNEGLPILREHEDELLPLVHSCWAPLAARCAADERALLRALRLLVTMATLARDFIRQRAATDVLPTIYTFLHKSARDSYLKDAGSAYRNSPPFQLQVAAIEALCTLVIDLGLEGDRLEDACACVDDYLSNKQPKPLQELAVRFFRAMLEYDYGATWYHLRRLADNECVLQPPEARLDLVPIIGTPYAPSNKDLESNLTLVLAGHDRHG